MNNPKTQNKVKDPTQQSGSVKNIAAVKPGTCSPQQVTRLSYSGQERNIINSWSDYLDNREWQLWTTLTTGRELTLAGARRSINKLASYLHQNHYPSEIFWCAEPFDLKEGYHLHSLIRFTDFSINDDNKQAYSKLVNGWRQITGDKSARIYSERYQPTKGASSYVGKYITKKRSDYDIITPGIHDDQKYSTDHDQETLREWLMKQQADRSKQAWRAAKVLELQEKGIYAGRVQDQPAKYNNKTITFDKWESTEYRSDLAARMAFPNKIGSPQFILRSKT